MKSAVDLYLDMLELDTRGVSGKLHGVFMGMLYTLANNNLLQESLYNIESCTDNTCRYDNQKIDIIKALLNRREMVLLYKYPKTLALLLKLLPHIEVTDDISVVTLETGTVERIINRATSNHLMAELKVTLRRINQLELGYKVFQRPRVSALDEFYIVKYKNKEELLRILQDNNLQSPSLLDKVLE